MTYLVLPLLIVIYLEFLGRALSKILKINSDSYSVVVGLIGLLSVSYLAFFIPIYLKVKFTYIFVIFCIVIVASLVLIVKLKIILEYKLNKRRIFIILLLTIILVLLSSYYYIGDLRIYDTISYTNLVSSNIYEPRVNFFDMENGYPGAIDGYSYQSYYMLASCFEYIANIICRVLNVNFYYFTQFIWLYSIVYYVVFSELFINLVDKRKNKNFFTLVISILLVFVFVGTWFLYSPFIGNSFRIILYSYVVVFIIKYSQNREKRYLHLMLLFLLASVATAACNGPVMLVYIFCFICIEKLDSDNYRIILIFSILPIINTLLVITSSGIIHLILLLFLIVLLMLKNVVLKIINKTNIYKWLPISMVSLLFVLQYISTGKLISFDTYLVSFMGSGTGWDFFDYTTQMNVITNITIWIIIFFTLFKNRKEKWSKILILILIYIFSPFTVEFIKKYFLVYQRFMEIIITPFFIFIFIDDFDDLLSSKSKVFKIFFASLLILTSFLIAENEYFNNKFMTRGKSNVPDGYDFWLKMTDDEADALDFARGFIFENNLQNSKVISNVYQLRSEIPTTKTLYNKFRRYYRNDANEQLLFEMLYPDEDYFGECHSTDEYDYSSILEKLQNSDYKLLIQGKNKIFHNKETDEYYPLFYEINKQIEPIYENNSFVIYDLR